MPQPAETLRKTDSTTPHAHAFDILMASRERFLGFLTRRVGSRDIAEDVLQAAFLKVIEKHSSLRDDERVEPWFYRLLRNAVIDHYRRRGAQTRLLERFTQDLNPEGPIDSGLEDAICQCVGEIVPTLKPEYADLLKRVDLKEGTLSEVSIQLGLTVNNTTVRLHRARAALRKRLGEFCGACTEHGCLSCLCKRQRAL